MYFQRKTKMKTEVRTQYSMDSWINGSVLMIHQGSLYVRCKENRLHGEQLVLTRRLRRSWKMRRQGPKKFGSDHHEVFFQDQRFSMNVFVPQLQTHSLTCFFVFLISLQIKVIELSLCNLNSSMLNCLDLMCLRFFTLLVSQSWYC